MKTVNPYIYIFASVILWGMAPPIAKLCLHNMNVYQMIFYMLCTACIGLFGIACVTGKISLIFRYSSKDFLHCAFMGFIGIFIYFMLLFLSFIYSPVQETYVVNYTWPLWMIAFTLFFIKEKISGITILCILLSFTGVLLIITKGGIFSFSYQHIFGYILALLAAVSYGFFSALVKIKRREPITSMLMYYLFSLFYAGITMFAFSSFTFPSVIELSGIIWLGVGSCALGFLFWLRSLQSGSLPELATIIYLTPFFTLFFVDILLGEPVQLYSIAGLVIILSALLINRLHLTRFRKFSIGQTP